MSEEQVKYVRNYADNNNCPSLCIPRVNFNIDRQFIYNVFKKIDIGNIKKIDIVEHYEQQFKSVFIHFYKWNNTPNAHIILKRILNGDTIKIVHDLPWFWKVSMNTKKNNYSQICNH